MDDDWDFYPLRVDGEPASIYLNLALKKVAPIERCPRMGYVRAHMRQPRPDGLSSNEEYDALIALEDALIADLTRDGRIVFVGRNTSGGCRDFCFYAESTELFEHEARRAVEKHPSYEFEIGSRDDPSWSVYLDFLYPSPRSMQLIWNRRVSEQLKENGDDPSKPRKIDHVALFNDELRRRQFVEHVQANGFTIASTSVWDAPSPNMAVEFHRTDLPSDIDTIVLELFDAVAALDGVYDGWGCTVET